MTLERLDWLSDHPQVIAAARIGKVFGQDPVALLRDNGDSLVGLIRAAAYRVVMADEKAVQDEAKRRK